MGSRKAATAHAVQVTWGRQTFGEQSEFTARFTPANSAPSHYYWAFRVREQPGGTFDRLWCGARAQFRAITRRLRHLIGISHTKKHIHWQFEEHGAWSACHCVAERH